MGFSWRTDDTFAILQLMKDRHECLWNTRSKFYRNKTKRDAAKLSIIRQLKRPGLTVKDLDGKLKSIRSRYSTELNKVKDAEKRARISGDVEDLFIPRLSWYQLANSFLRDVTLSKKVVQDGGEDCTMVDCQLDDLTNATFEDYYQQHYNRINNSNTDGSDNDDQQQRLNDDSIEDQLEEEEGKYEINLDPESFKCEPMAETIIESRPLRNRLRSAAAVSVVNGQQQPNHQLHPQTTNHDNHYYQNNGNSTLISGGPITNNNQHHSQPHHHHLPHFSRHSNSRSSLGPDDKDPLFEQSHHYPFARMVASYLDQLPLERALISSCRIMNLLTEERLKHCREQQQQQSSSNTGNNQTEPNHHQEIMSLNEPIIQSTKMSSLSDQIQPNGLVYPSSSSASSSLTIPEIAMPDF